MTPQSRRLENRYGLGVDKGLAGVGNGLLGLLPPVLYHVKCQVWLIGLTMGPFHCPLGCLPVYRRIDTFQVSWRDSGTRRYR